MAVSGSKFMGLVLAVVIAVGMSSSGQRVAAQMCNTDVMDAAAKCGKFVGKSGPKVSPSPGCCAVVKDADLACLCSYLTKEIEELISMEKAVYVVRTCGCGRACGKKISPGSKCGRYTVPAA